jgi:hypothetical protein
MAADRPVTEGHEDFGLAVGELCDGSECDPSRGDLLANSLPGRDVGCGHCLICADAMDPFWEASCWNDLVNSPLVDDHLVEQRAALVADDANDPVCSTRRDELRCDADRGDVTALDPLG